MEEEILTTEDMAKQLRVSTKTILTLIKDGHIPAFKVGRVYRVYKEDFDKYLENSKVKKENE